MEKSKTNSKNQYKSSPHGSNDNPMTTNMDIDKIIEELKTSRISERSGRAQDKEDDYMMQKLRALGYM